MSIPRIAELFTNVFDNFTNGIKILDTDHYYIHQGKKFFYSENFTLATTAIKYISFTTPTIASGLEVHYRPELISCSADKLKIELYESATVTGGNDKLTEVYNYNRISTSSTSMQLFKNDTTQSVAGTNILNQYIGGGTGVGGRNIGGSTTQLEERVLKKNTTYTLKIINNSSGNNIINTIITWYEENI